MGEPFDGKAPRLFSWKPLVNSDGSRGSWIFDRKRRIPTGSIVLVWERFLALF
jgi:hypothetical protein